MITLQSLSETTRKDAGVVDRDGLENRCTLTRTQGSNPCLSARKCLYKTLSQYQHPINQPIFLTDKLGVGFIPLISNQFHKYMKDIKVEMFALCQGAHNLDGHLTVVNTMDEFLVRDLPSHVSFGLAIKLYIQANIEGNKELSIFIIDKSNGNNILPGITTTLHIEKYDKASHINMAFNLQNVIFDKEGLYDIHLELDGERLDDFAFEVICKK